ncbi:hypothetical protein U0035_00240 [Niabella yanshanensis]|uniref:Uncharacterized protein n=1 Tax=Niabella yanshanensis TaxID=577386 RepID=A0ABZ0W6K3_9BACT|nr:hypothetical protein [Niabella yanshanensis]WQD38574.1 hypothetical protein U0035_00240 [Niabella yanshanensis]
MTQMIIPMEMQVRLDYERKDWPPLVRELRPIIWEEGPSYCCLLGPDFREGILGYGPTIEEAVADWELHVQERLEHHEPGDEIAAFIEETLQVPGIKSGTGDRNPIRYEA